MKLNFQFKNSIKNKKKTLKKNKYEIYLCFLLANSECLKLNDSGNFIF